MIETSRRRVPLALGAFGFLNLSSALARARRVEGVKVIVVGAGMSGLSAGQSARELGANVSVLEARDRVGGRIWTDRSLGVPVDLGASWIHGPMMNPITRLADKVQADRHRTDFEDALAYGPGGKALPESRLVDASERTYEIFEEVAEGAKSGETMARAIQRFFPNFLSDSLHRALASAIAEFDGGAPLDQLSTIPDEGTDEYWGSDVLFPDGYDGVLAALTPNLDIHLSQVVESIEWNESGVEVATKSKTWRGDFCVVTLPIGVLKSKSVRFGPDLPIELTEAIDRIGAGLVNKVALRFERAFWDDAQFIFSAEDSARFPLFFNQNIFQPKGNVLVNYGLGNFAEVVDKRPIAELEAELMKRLKEIYGTSAIDPVGSVASSW